MIFQVALSSRQLLFGICAKRRGLGLEIYIWYGVVRKAMCMHEFV